MPCPQNPQFFSDGFPKGLTSKLCLCQLPHILSLFGQTRGSHQASLNVGETTQRSSAISVIDTGAIDATQNCIKVEEWENSINEEHWLHKPRLESRLSRSMPGSITIFKKCK